jgi:hypothetical protein
VLKIEMSAKATTRPQETSGSPHEEREGNKNEIEARKMLLVWSEINFALSLRPQYILFSLSVVCL